MGEKEENGSQSEQLINPYEQQSIINPLHHQHQQQQQEQQELQERQQQQAMQYQQQQQYNQYQLMQQQQHQWGQHDEELLIKKMQTRPTEKELFARNILINKNERLEHRRRASQSLIHSLSQRPTFSDLVERGILMNENEQFNEKIRELLSLIETSPNILNPTKNKIYHITNDIKEDYSSMISRLNGQIFEYKQTLNQFQADVQSREERLRRELENKQRVLIHMNGIIEQQKKDQKNIKNEHELQIKELKEEYKEKFE